MEIVCKVQLCQIHFLERQPIAISSTNNSEEKEEKFIEFKDHNGDTHHRFEANIRMYPIKH